MSFQVRKLQKNKISGGLRFPKKVFSGVAYIFKKSGWQTAKTVITFLKYRQEKQQTETRIIFLKKTLMVLLVVLCTIVLSIGTIKILVQMRLLNLETITSISKIPPPEDENGLTNILLLGQGDKNHDGVDLTDTIIIASIDAAKTKSVVLLSIPRDLQLTSEFFGDKTIISGRKINALYRDIKYYYLYRKGYKESDASKLALQDMRTDIEKITGLPIHHVIKVNFSGFVSIVDEVLQGVELEVPYDIVDTQYPDENYGYTTFIIREGLQKLDGETALKYARSRHTTSDFSRSARQQQLLSAMGEKAKEMGILKKPTKLLQIWKSFSAHTETTMSLQELIGLADLGRKIDRQNIINYQFNDSNGLYNVLQQPAGLLYSPPREQFDGHAVLLPVSMPPLPVTWKQIQLFIRLLSTEREIYLEKPSLTILNAGAVSGSAGNLKREFVKFGINVEEIANVKLKEKLEKSFIYFGDREGKKKTRQFLTELLSLPVSDSAQNVQEINADTITIVLGQDFNFTFFQDLPYFKDQQ